MYDNQESTSYPLQNASFFSQVMLYFALAILTSAAGAYAGFNYLWSILIANPGTSWLIYAAELVLVFTSRTWSTKRPLNYLLFMLFAFLTGVTLVPLLASILYEFGGPDLIIKAFCATTMMFGACAVFGWVTHKNLSGLGGFLYMSLFGVVVISILHVFWPWSNTFEMIFAGFGILLFSGFTMYDIQQLKVYPQERAIDAALNLYLDIFNLFVFILRLMSGNSRR